MGTEVMEEHGSCMSSGLWKSAGVADEHSSQTSSEKLLCIVDSS